MSQPYIFNWFGLVPIRLLQDFWLWQPFTYFFLHSDNVFHLVLNMLVLWFLGAELEGRWGEKFFLLYYLVCGIGAGFLYFFGVIAYSLISGQEAILGTQVVGASGSVFGIMLAYGMIYGERVIYFMMIFPMKAKYFVTILGAIELVSLLNSGMGGPVANLAHLGGLVSGYLFLFFWRRKDQFKRNKPQSRSRRNLKLVVDNDREGPQQGPKYWN